MVLANAAEPLAGIADTVVIGTTGDTSELAGVALGVTATNLLVYTVYFIRLSTTGLVAKALGAGDGLEAQRVLVRAVLLGAGLGLLGLCLGGPLAEAAFAVLGGAPEGVAAGQADLGGYPAGQAYFRFRTFGHPAGFALFALSGWLIAHGRTGAVLGQQLIFSLTNVGLDVVFVLGLDLGAGGVGLATALAQGVACLFGLVQVLRGLRPQGGPDPRAWSSIALLDGGAWRELTRVNLDFMVRTWALLVGFTWFTRAGAMAGDMVLAANHVLIQVISFWSFVLDAFAHVAEAEVGRAFGRRSLRLFRRAVRVTGELSLASGALFAAATLFLGPILVDAVVGSPGVAEAAKARLMWCAAVPLLGAPTWLLDGVFVGATASRAMRNASVLSVLVYLGLDTALRSAWGPAGIWPAFLGYYVARGATLAVRYPRLEASVEAPET